MAKLPKLPSRTRSPGKCCDWFHVLGLKTPSNGTSATAIGSINWFHPEPVTRNQTIYPIQTRSYVMLVDFMTSKPSLTFS